MALPEAESLHASRVLRLAPGDRLTLMDGRGKTADATITDISKRGNQLFCHVEEVTEHQPPKYPIRLYIAPPRAKIMELVVRFATEMGVARITPILCRYGVSKPEGSKEGCLQTAIVAMKQSRNPWLPALDGPMPFADALKAATECCVLGAVPRQNAPKRLPAQELCQARGIALWVGPEGGFSPDEEERLLAKSAIPMTVGPCILRVETAVPALLGGLYALLNGSQ